MAFKWLTYNNKVLVFGSKIIGSTIPPFTLRFQFTDTSYDPRNDSSKNSSWKSRWKLVNATNGIYDWTYENANWSNYFYNWRCPSTYSIIDAGDTSGVTRFDYMFNNTIYENRHLLLSTIGFDLSSARGAAGVSHMFYGCEELTSIPYFNLTGVKNVSGMFCDCSSISSVSPDLNFSSAENISDLFKGTALETIPLFDFSNATNGEYLFYYCPNLKSLPNLNLSKITNAAGIIRRCTSLTTIPQCMFNLTSATNVNGILEGSVNVASRILDFYNYLSTKQVTITDHLNAFENCGSNTTTGAAELAQIPSDWK